MSAFGVLEICPLHSIDGFTDHEPWILSENPITAETNSHRYLPAGRQGLQHLMNGISTRWSCGVVLAHHTWLTICWCTKFTFYACGARGFIFRVYGGCSKLTGWLCEPSRQSLRFWRVGYGISEVYPILMSVCPIDRSVDRRGLKLKKGR